MKIWLAAMCSMASAMGAACAAEISVNVRDEQGEVVDDAVVVLSRRGAGANAARSPVHREERVFYQIVQKDLRFSPHILVVPSGATVAFPNQDTVRHHVYSFSPAKKFELALYGQDEDRSITFDKPGIIAIGCNIHDDMQAYIYVYDSAQQAKLSEQGSAAFSNLPEGEYTITVWHPRLKRHDDAKEQIVRAAGEVSYSATVKMPLRPAHRPARTSY